MSENISLAPGLIVFLVIVVILLILIVVLCFFCKYRPDVIEKMGIFIKK